MDQRPAGRVVRHFVRPDCAVREPGRVHRRRPVRHVLDRRAARRRKADPHRRRAARKVDREPDEAHERRGSADVRGERLLPVADPVGVRVRRVEDRQVPAVQPGRRQAGEAGSVALVATPADGERERRAGRPIRDDLAPVGDVQRDGASAARTRGLTEGQVVHARVRETKAACARGPTDQQQRCQVPLGSCVRRAVPGCDQALPQAVSLRLECALDPCRVGRAEVRATTRVDHGRMSPGTAERHEEDGCEEDREDLHHDHAASAGMYATLVGRVLGCAGIRPNPASATGRSAV